MDLYCKYCDDLKSSDQFTACQLKRKTPKCRRCVSLYDAEKYILNREYNVIRAKIYRKENLDKIIKYNKQYKLLNRDSISEYNKQYYKNNIEYFQEYAENYYNENSEQLKFYSINYRINNRELINERNNFKYENDPQFRIRLSVSNLIRQKIFKGGESFKAYLPYTVEDLKIHLEQQFGPWMNWQNHGRYNAETWNDNNQSTWTWQIDHIIPHSLFKYSSMEDEEFKRCWALENLRPLDAKQNYLDGITRSRHNLGENNE